LSHNSLEPFATVAYIRIVA